MFFHAFIEGIADAVRIANGGFPGPQERPKGGDYMDGYRTAGYFFLWIRDNKDPEFLQAVSPASGRLTPL